MISKQDDGLILKTAEGTLRLRVLSDTIIQVLFTLDENLKENKSLSILDVKKSQIKFEISEENGIIKLNTNRILIQIDNDGSLKFLNSSGLNIMKENGRELIRTVIQEEKVYNIKQNFKWADDEALYGLGQHQDVNSQINYRGSEVDLYQGNMKVSVPILVSSKGYGILWDNYSFTKFRDSDEGSFLWSEVADEINYYFIYGPEIDLIIKDIRLLSGFCPMFPKWFFGYVQCKQRYKTAEELVGIVEEYRKRKIPIDLIVQDWRYWGSLLKWGDKCFVKKRFPFPFQTINKIHDLNAKIMISIWPLMSRFTSDYKEMKKHDYLYKGRFTKVYDAFNEEARALFWNQANEGLFKYGIDAWWCDCTEPRILSLAKKSISREEFSKRSVRYLKTMSPIIGTAARYLNAYSLMHSKGIYENQRETTSEKRVVNLTRSGFTGQQRFATVVWSGDISARWEVLAAQIPAGLNFCITGIPHWTTDIGAFFTKAVKYTFLWRGDFPKGVDDLGYREFYTRWFQFGTFCPMFRSHGQDTPREVWRFGEPGTIFYDTLVKFIKLRYRLLTYIYSLAGMVTQRDYTMMRALVFDFPDDLNILDINDEYMFGPSYLVCPVLEPIYYNTNSQPINDAKRKRSVYLPKGADWYDFWTGKQYTGGQTIEAEAPIEIMPLFVKAGSIIPMNPDMQYSTEKPADPLELRIYRGADGKFTLYEDENDNYNYENGIFSTIEIIWNDKESRLVIKSRQGEYPGMLENRTIRLLFVGENKGIGPEESTEYDDIIEYKGEQIEKEYY